MHRFFPLVACLSVASSVMCVSTSGFAATPETTFRQGIEAIAANQPDALFALLPDSYQRDVDRLVSTVADTIDPEIWIQGRKLLQRLAGVIDGQQDLLAAFAAQHMGKADHPATAPRNWNAAVPVLTRFANGSLSDQQRLRQGNVRELLADEGRVLMQMMHDATDQDSDETRENLWSMAQQAQIRVDHVADDTATLHLTANQETETMALRRVEDRWIPAPLAENWKQGTDTFLAAIQSVDYTTPEGQAKKQQTLSMLMMLNVVLGQIEQAKSIEELQTSMFGILMMLGAMGGMPPAGL